MIIRDGTPNLTVASLRAQKPDIFLGYTIKPVIWGLFAARLAHVPKRIALMTGLGYAFTGQHRGKRGLIQWVARRLYSKALQFAHLAFSKTPTIKLIFQGLVWLPVTCESMVLRGSGVDLGTFTSAPFPNDKYVF